MPEQPTRVLRLRTDHFNLFCHVTLAEAEDLAGQLAGILRDLRTDHRPVDLHAGPQPRPAQTLTPRT